MPFFPFSKKNKKIQQLYLSLDIGTEFVKCIIFQVDQNSLLVQSVGKVRQPITAVKNGQVTNVKHVIDTARAAIEKAMVSIDSFLPENVVMGIAGELVRGIPIVVNFVRDNPESKITMQEIEKVIGKVTAPAMEEAKKFFAENTGRTDIEIRNVNRTIVEALIDGYRVENPIGFPGKNLQMTIYSTYAPLLHIGALENVAKILHLRPILISAEPFAVARSVIGARDESFESIIIDIGGGTTDIAIVKKGGVVDTHILAFGGRVFTKRISQEMNIDYDKAEELKVDYANGSLERPIANIVKKAIGKDIHVWASGVELVLKEFSTVKVFPSHILLCGGGSLLPEIKDILIQYPWVDVLPFDRVPKVTFLHPHDIDGVIDENNLVEGIDMVTPLSLARLVLDMQSRGKEDSYG